MKDAYSFDRSASGLDASYQACIMLMLTFSHAAACNSERLKQIPALLAVRIPMNSWPWRMLVRIQSSIVHPASMRRILEKAIWTASLTKSASSGNISQLLNQSKVHTPGVTSIKQLSQFLTIEPHQIIKSVALQADGDAVIVLVRGDLEINEIKLKQALGVQEVSMLSEAEILQLGSIAGFIGPIGLTSM